MKRLALVLALLGLAASCRTQDNTMIVVEVDTDLAVPSQLDTVRIEVTGPTDSSSKSYPLSLSQQLPIRLALVPDAAKDASLTVKATGLLVHVEIVWQAVRVAFVPGESKLLRLNLTRQCAYVACRPTESCSAGMCTQVPTIIEIPNYDPHSSTPATGGGAGATVLGGSGGNAGGVVVTGGLTSVAGASTGGTSTTGGRVVVGGSGSGGRGGSGGITAGTGGTSRSSSSGGTGGVCLGGDVVGIWDVKSSSLKTSGPADITYLGLECRTAQITGTANVTGRLTLTADGKYTDKTVTTGSDSWTLDPRCLQLSGTKVSCSGIGIVFAAALSSFGYVDFQCADASTGGCTCQGTINQAGGMGVLHNDLTPTGRYRVAGDIFMLGDTLTYSYCSKGGQMTMSPRPGNMESTPYTGTIVLQNAFPGTGGTGGTGGIGGSTGGAGTGGSSASSSGDPCVSGTACGGEVVGTWNVISSCLNLNGDFVDRGTGLGCDTFKVTGSLQVKGSFVAGADGKFQDKTTTTGAVMVKLDHQCLNMSGTWTQCDLISVAVEALGFDGARCTDAPDGGCTCPASVKQSGTMGLIVAEPQNSGSYTISNTTMVTGMNALTGAELAYSYCVVSDKLTVIPKTSSPPTTGSIVLQKSK